MLGFFISFGAFFLIVGIGAAFGAPYVPSQRKYLKKAFEELYPLNASDVLVDIGAGDGIVLREAAKKGARAIGYEINPLLFGVASLLGRKYDGVELRLANFWTAHLPEETTVVYAFSVNRDAGRLIAKLQAQADLVGRPVALVCLGSPLKDRIADAELDAYKLYEFTPGSNAMNGESDRV
jgi:hypothetical protein